MFCAEAAQDPNELIILACGIDLFWQSFVGHDGLGNVLN